MERWLVFHIELAPIILSQLHTISCISNWSLPFQGIHSNHFHSHTSVWFSSAQFGSVQAACGTCFMYNNQRGCSQTWKSQIVWVCVYKSVYSRQTHWATGLLPTWFACLPGRDTVSLTCPSIPLLHAAGWPVLGNDGWTPPHHHQVVCTHWPLLG